MSDLNTKMLQALIDGQSALREHLSSDINKLRSEIREVRKDLKNLDERLTSRIDKIGRQLAYLEDDTPTREEHQSLEKRVTRIEIKLAAPAI